MANSIIVVDEAHLMPQNYLKPCLRAISFITKTLNSEAVFLTATMPDFRHLIDEYSLPNSVVTNLVDDTSLFSRFGKCSYECIGSINPEALIMKASSNAATLIVVNKRSSARNIFSLCSGKRFHLSTYMTAYDRKRTIEKIKEELAQLENDFPNFENVPDERKITVVSTSLIEAGVDLDFSCVFRELSGLDNILQAGGRCNREGKRKNAKVYIFSFENEKILSDVRPSITKGLMQEYEDISCAESIKNYYDRLFDINANNIAKNSISENCSCVSSIPFSTYAKDFKMIKSNTISIVVPQDETSRQLVERLKQTGFCDHRKLQKYAFSVYLYEFEILLKQHVIDDFKSGIWCLTNEDYYNKEIGVIFEAQDYFI